MLMFDEYCLDVDGTTRTRKIIISFKSIVSIVPWYKDEAFSVITIDDPHNIACDGDTPIIENTSFVVNTPVAHIAERFSQVNFSFAK